MWNHEQRDLIKGLLHDVYKKFPIFINPEKAMEIGFSMGGPYDME